MTTEPPDYFDPTEPARAPTRRPIDAATESLTSFARQAGFDLPAGLDAIRLAPGKTPVGSPGYGDRIGTWSEIEDFMAMWARQGGTWVNLAWEVDDHGEPYIAYETQWREGDPEEPQQDGRDPDLNLSRRRLPHANPPYFETE